MIVQLKFQSPSVWRFKKLPMPDKIIALVPAAGVGARAGTIAPKQYASVAGKPMIAHTLAALLSCEQIESIAVIVSPEDSFAKAFIPAHPRIEMLFFGGESRAETVLNGLAQLRRRYSDSVWVLVHDAARCCISTNDIESLIARCVSEPDGQGGILAVPVTDSLKASVASKNQTAPRIARAVARDTLWQALTPQMFRLGALHGALQCSILTDITDEASAMECCGHHPLLIQGKRSNIKVTYPEDFALAAMILSANTKCDEGEW
jgi:2-C-methyl-D-erythritol 4-phosphate cytidylyltransferase